MTACAIAKQIGIITRKTPEDLMDENPSLTAEQAFEQAEAIVIHGDRILKA